MTEVFKEYYELKGAKLLKAARDHAAAQEKARKAHWVIVKELGGYGYRPSYYGGIKSLLFKAEKAPDGFRKIGTDKNCIECVPARNTAKGKAAEKLIAVAVPEIPSWGRFCDDILRWNGRSPIGGGSGSRTGFCIYHATGVHISRPKERFIVVLPRTLSDGWKRPEGLKEIRESDMLRAVEDHNALIGKRKQRAKCSYADRYQAKRAPTCGCKACEKKWKDRNK